MPRLRRRRQALIFALAVWLNLALAVYFCVGIATWTGWGPEVAVLIPALLLPLVGLSYLIWPAPRGGPGICQHCGYDLYGLPARRCPECGARS